jgi:Protein of unknown function (DUF2846)
MKPSLLILTLLTTATVASAQQSATVQMQCHDPASSGNVLGPDEVLINGMACHPVKQASPQNQNAALREAPTATPTQSQVSPAGSTSTIAQPTTASSAPRAVPAPASSEQAQATIYFYRPRRFQGSALKPSVFVDDARVGHLRNGDSIKVSVATGSHRIYSTDKGTGMELDAKGGETYYVRIDIQVGLFKGHGGVTLIDPQQGKYEVSQAAHQGADDNQ